jgi:hypothetical protein
VSSSVTAEALTNALAGANAIESSSRKTSSSCNSRSAVHGEPLQSHADIDGVALDESLDSTTHLLRGWLPVMDG